MFLSDQYEVRELIGKGGMGKVYKAYDRKLRTSVAIKTIVGVPDAESVKLFRKECSVLTSLCHANIVDIKAIGEFEEGGERKPFFVMPFLPGVPLGKLIWDPDLSHRLTVETTVDIIEDVCRALQSAHDKGIIHRDIKPSNIFVMDDNSVKVIDFGIALMVDARTTIEQGGTPLYMSPEQLAFAPLTPATDIFSLGVVFYEALTRRHPFKEAPEGIREAILHSVPPAASSLNGSVSFALSQVVHKAMAKAPQYRFSSADEFRGMLQKVLRNEPVQMFDISRIGPRIDRARKAYENGDLSYAAEMLEELQAEGHLDSEVSTLQDQINRSKRQKRIQQLLESARARIDQQEYGLAMQKVQEVLEIDRENASALGLKSRIMELNTNRSVDEWLRLAQHHLANRSYKHAVQALQDVLKNRPRDEQALQLLADVNRSEREYLKLCAEKEKAYEAARAAWQNGEISTSLSRMQAVVDLEQKAPDPTSHERAALYQQFYNQVRSEHDLLKSGYDEAARHLQAGQFKKALERCEQFLEKYPNYAPLQMLRFDIEERERQELSKYVAEVDRLVEAEPDFDKRVAILKEAAVKYPAEAHFTGHLKLLERKRELVRGIVAKARILAEREQFTEARAQWESLFTIYPQYPALDLEIERVKQKRDQQMRAEEKGHGVQQVNDRLESGEYAASLEAVRSLMCEFPEEPELHELERRAERGLDRSTEIGALRLRGRHSIAERKYDDGLQALRAAYRLDERNRISRGDLASGLLEYANLLMLSDSHTSRSLVEESLNVDPANAWAKSLAASLAELEARKRIERPARVADLADHSRISDETPLLSPVPGPLAGPKRGDPIPSRRVEADYDALELEGAAGGPAVPGATVHPEPLTGDPAAGAAVSRRPGGVTVAAALFRACRSAVSAAAELVRVRGARAWRGLSTLVRSKPAVRAAGSVQRARYYPYLMLAAGGVLIAAGISALLVTGARGRHVAAPGPSVTEFRVTTSPPGASVQIDGKPCGLTPCAVRLSAGVYHVRALKAGYADAQQTFALNRAESQASLTLTLQPLIAGVRV
ncbi:MAG: protein kinase domain-containing protein, partial [Terriglobia bacterium]